MKRECNHSTCHSYAPDNYSSNDSNNSCCIKRDTAGLETCIDNTNLSLMKKLKCDDENHKTCSSSLLKELSNLSTMVSSIDSNTSSCPSYNHIDICRSGSNRSLFEYSISLSSTSSSSTSTSNCWNSSNDCYTHRSNIMPIQQSSAPLDINETNGILILENIRFVNSNEKL